jgi:hypothetical protein
VRRLGLAGRAAIGALVALQQRSGGRPAWQLPAGEGAASSLPAWRLLLLLLPLLLVSAGLGPGHGC